jgi:hypothetical protein
MLGNRKVSECADRTGVFFEGKVYAEQITQRVSRVQHLCKGHCVALTMYVSSTLCSGVNKYSAVSHFSYRVLEIA